MPKTTASVTIENLEDEFNPDIKRFRAPIEIYSTCPHCGKEVTRDLMIDEHLYYPWFNTPEKISFYHHDYEYEDESGKLVYVEEHEWDSEHEYILKVSYERVTPEREEVEPITELLYDTQGTIADALLEKLRKECGVYVNQSFELKTTTYLLEALEQAYLAGKRSTET